jgi:hypothetical protein
MEQITQLPEVIEGSGQFKGFTFTQVAKKQGVYLYRTGSGSYHVFYAKTAKVCLDFEKRIYSETELKEVYPRPEDFGKWAWQIDDIDDAISKFETKRILLSTKKIKA